MDRVVRHRIRDLDALVVGAGFGGIYTLHKLRNEQGLDAVAIDKAGGVGGTWYWNKYPGALSDSPVVRVPGTRSTRNLYTQNPEVDPTGSSRGPRSSPISTAWWTATTCVEHVHLEDRHDRSQMGRDLRHTGPSRTDRGGHLPGPASSSQVLGILSATNTPEIHGIETLRGSSPVHSGAWPRGAGPDRQAGRRDRQRLHRQPGDHRRPPRVAAHLTSFQRSPQYSVPVRQPSS